MFYTAGRCWNDDMTNEGYHLVKVRTFRLSHTGQKSQKSPNLEGNAFVNYGNSSGTKKNLRKKNVENLGLWILGEVGFQKLKSKIWDFDFGGLFLWFCPVCERSVRFRKNRSRLLLMRIHSTKGKTCGEIHFSHGAKKTRGTDEENFRFIGLHLISDNLPFL